MRNKVESYMGFAAKARKIVNGYNTCSFMIEKKKVKLLILAKDLGENSRKKMVSVANRYGVPVKTYGTIDQLSHITGTVGIGIFAITDEEFSKIISEEIDNIQSLEKEVF